MYPLFHCRILFIIVQRSIREKERSFVESRLKTFQAYSTELPTFIPTRLPVLFLQTLCGKLSRYWRNQGHIFTEIRFWTLAVRPRVHFMILDAMLSQ